MMLRTLNTVMLADGDTETVIRLLDVVIDFCAAHFTKEEGYLRRQGDSDIDAHVAAHRQLTEHFVAVRTALRGGSAEATLDAADLLPLLHAHTEHWDHQAYESILARASENGVYQEQELERLRRRSPQKMQATSDTSRRVG